MINRSQFKVKNKKNPKNISPFFFQGFFQVVFFGWVSWVGIFVPNRDWSLVIFMYYLDNLSHGNTLEFWNLEDL